jgi:YD repeat-containing protein
MQRVISATDAENNIITQSYNPWGQVKEITDASQNLYVSEYDIRNNKVMSYFVAKNNIASYRANTNSNTYKEDYVEVYIDQFGRTTERRVYENWPVLNGTLSEVYRYDISGNLIGYTDPKNNLNEDGVTTTYQYDALNRITTVKDAMNQITNINYTVLGQISSVAIKQNAASAASENLYTKTYDELGNISGKADSTSLITDYSYNTIGLNTKVIDRNGSTLNIAYDELARVKETNQFSSDNTKSLRHLYNNNSPFGYTSDSMYTNGTLTTSNTFTYNANGQVIKKDTTGSGYILSNLKLNYDNAGRLNSVGAGVAGNNYFYANYMYTGDRLNQIQTNGLQANSTADTDNVIYKYFPDGKLEKITYPKLKDGSYLTTEYTYNPIGRMTSMVNKKGTTILSQFIYTYDANGNILSVNDGHTTKTYVYDK